MRAERGQVGGAEHVDAGHERRFGGAREWQIDFRGRLFACHKGVLPCRAADHREGAAHRAERARQRQFAREFAPRKRLDGNLPARREDAKRDGQVEAAGLFREIGGSEVDGDAANRKFEAAVLKRGAHALAAFADFEVGQPDNRK
ncbi:hypothetical protein AWB68_06798 [Caballeronia choica]|uniref:Uncharacterized protein n=1 Tax=Caballeronia choica TaxID=326476 RepID=A0A158KPT1_9BURK|nr:hypothetical protein AWB68_06798 [Caballeronia choica]